MADDNDTPEVAESPAQPAAPDAPTMMGAQMMDMAANPAVMAHHHGIGPFVDNSQWRKSPEEVGMRESDIQDYVGKAGDFYNRKMQEQFPDLAAEDRQKKVGAFTKTLTGAVRDYAVEKYANTINETGGMDRTSVPYIVSKLPFGRLAGEAYSEAKSEEAKSNIDAGKAQPWDFFMAGMERAQAKHDAARSMGGQFFDAVASAPAFLTEWGALSGPAAAVSKSLLAGSAMGAAGKYATNLALQAGVRTAASQGIRSVVGGQAPSVRGTAGDMIDNALFTAIGPVSQEAHTFMRGLVEGIAANEVSADAKKLLTIAPRGGLLSDLATGQPNAIANFISQNAGPMAVISGVVHGLKAKGIDPSSKQGQEVGQDAATSLIREQLRKEGVEPPPITEPASSATNAPGTPISTREAPKPTQEPVGTGIGQSEAAKAGIVRYGQEGGPDSTHYPSPADMTDDQLGNHIANHEVLEDAVRSDSRSSGDEPETIRRSIPGYLQSNPDTLRADLEKQGAGLQGSEGPAETQAPGAVPETTGHFVDPDVEALKTGTPAFISNKLKQVAERYGIEIGPEDKPNEVIQRIIQTAEAGKATPQDIGETNQALQSNLHPPLQADEIAAVEKQAQAEDAAEQAALNAGQHLAGSAGGPGAEGVGPGPGGRPGTKQSAVGDVGDPADHNLVGAATSVSRWQQFRDFWGKLAGATAPRMTRASTAASEKLAQLAAVKDYLHERLPQLIDQVLGKNTTDEEAKAIGTTFQEMRHRAAIQNLKAAARQLEIQGKAGMVGEDEAMMEKADELRKWADGISTFVGGEGSPLTDEATYQAYANSPKMKDFLQRWQQLVVPEMEKNTRSARGLEDTDPIDSITQMAGFPMHAKAIREGDTPLASVGARRGNLAGMKTYRDPYQNRAFLTHDKYDTDIRSIMEESLNRTTRNARMAEFQRTAVAEGIGAYSAPNNVPEGFKSFPSSRPPKGTQNAEPGDIFSIRDDLYDETHQAFGLDRPFLRLPFTSSATWWALQSTAEATYHLKNLLTGMFKPGMNPGDLFKNAYQVLTSDPYAAQRMVDLARMGAGTTRQSTFDPKNPLTYMGKLVDLMDRSVRLTAGDAFDKILRTKSTGVLAEKLGLKVNIDGSEASKRDFVNQVAGNYNKLTQSRMVAWARDVGIGPFATAGTTYWANGIRSLVGESGLKGTDTASDLKLRATMLAKPLAILGAVMAYNYARWGRVDGDDATDFGAMKLGEHNGKSISFNPLNFTGLPRGIRAVGAMPALNQEMHGKDVGTTEVGKGLTNIAGSALHPFLGPAGQTVVEGVTGHNLMGMKIAPDARKGQSQAWLNWKAALLNSNPLLANWTGADNPYKDKSDWVEKAWKTLGPFGVQFRKPPRH